MIEIAAGSLSPHYTSSQWNAAFPLPGVTVRQLSAGSYGPVYLATLLWEPGDRAHCNHSNSLLPRPSHMWFTKLPQCSFGFSQQLYELFIPSLIHSTECQLRGFCLLGGRYYCISASLWLGIVFIQQILFCIYCVLGIVKSVKIPKWTKPGPSPQGAHNCKTRMQTRKSPRLKGYSRSVTTEVEPSVWGTKKWDSESAWRIREPRPQEGTQGLGSERWLVVYQLDEAEQRSKQ